MSSVVQPGRTAVGIAVNQIKNIERKYTKDNFCKKCVEPRDCNKCESCKEKVQEYIGSLQVFSLNHDDYLELLKPKTVLCNNWLKNCKRCNCKSSHSLPMQAAANRLLFELRGIENKARCNPSKEKSKKVTNNNSNVSSVNRQPLSELLGTNRAPSEINEDVQELKKLENENQMNLVRRFLPLNLI